MKLVERIVSSAQRLLGRMPEGPPPEEAERLSALFRERYHAFRVLLAANGRALDAMARMERALTGSEPYGMNFVVSNATSVAVRVYRMVRHLDVLAPGVYSGLFERFDAIKTELDEALKPMREVPDAPPVLRLGEIGRDDSELVGAKMANLGEIHTALGLAVPPGFVITATAFRRLLEHNDLGPDIDRLITSTEIDRPDALFELSSQLQRLIANAEVPPDVEQAVAEALVEIRASNSDVVGLAVRSSAFGEDTADTSFAGLYRSELNVHPDNLLPTYLEIAASKYTPQAMVYRRQHGLRDEDTAMAVGCMAMVDSAAGGVVYTADPQEPDDDRVYVSAAFGLPKAVVDGRFDADLYLVDRGSRQVVERRISDQQTAFVLRPGEGIARQPVPSELASEAVLTDDEAIAVASVALDLESHFGGRQDVEWARTHDGELIILQCRPMHHARVPMTLPRIDGKALVRGGVCVSPGVAAGPVTWVRSDREALKLKDGAVLVVDYPDPRWASLLDRTAAVVSEHGGIAGHLATVAREFGIPAIFGIGSLEALERGATVTVDAEGLAIHPGRINGLADHRQRPNLMDGSPIQETLRRALEHIAPLTLLDPSSPEFQPVNVQTMHDITRFCHEMSVREMFNFGRDHEFPKYAAKQLHHNVPMQWWVLNLDDGFAHEITGRYVKLDEITCQPMHALWEGMVAVPWDGPPAVSGSGLASVLFEATRNPALATPFRKPYAQRNYFMVSSNFLNLQSRFGFHFSTVETLAGIRDDENYIVFSFKGGAADMERRALRAQFIAELLADRGFGLKVIEDTVTARASALPQEAILQMVRIVGYLLMHTRQLDMIMGDAGTRRRYRAKLEADIESLGGA
jgi:pyruvate,water dikinase